MIDNKKVDTAFEKIDDVMVNVFNSEDLTFEEIALVFWRLRQKIKQQELMAYTMYLSNEQADEQRPKEQTENQKTSRDDIYR